MLSNDEKVQAMKQIAAIVGYPITLQQVEHGKRDIQASLYCKVGNHYCPVQNGCSFIALSENQAIAGLFDKIVGEYRYISDLYDERGCWVFDFKEQVWRHLNEADIDSIEWVSEDVKNEQ